MAESFSREKMRQASQKEGDNSYVTFLLCDPGWYVYKPEVQNKWDKDIFTNYNIVTLRVF